MPLTTVRGTEGGFRRCAESRVAVGLSIGDNIDTERRGIHLSDRDEHSAAGKKRHEFNEHGAPLRGTGATRGVDWGED